MSDSYQKQVQAPVDSRKTGVSTFLAPGNKTIVAITVWGLASSHSKAGTFNISLNGVAQFSGLNKFKITDIVESVEKTGLSIAVTKGDVLSLDMEDISPYIQNVVWQVDFESDVAGLPVGGTTGQVLTKESTTDGDANWEDPASGGATSLSGLTDVDLTGLVDGDLLIYNSGTGKFEPQVPSSGGAGFTYYEPDMPYGTPSAFDDEFNAGSLDVKWLTHNVIPTITFPVPNHAVIVPSSSSQYRGIYQAPSWSNGDTYIMKLRPTIVSGDSLIVGFLVVDNGGSLFAFNVSLNGASATAFWEFWLNNTTLYQSDNIGTFVLGPDLYIKLKYDSSGTKKLLGWISGNCVIWRQVLDTSARSFNISNAGGLTKFGVQCYGTSTTGVGIDWIRKQQSGYPGQNITI